MKDLLDRLRASVESFTDFLRAIPPEQTAPARWGPREVLVHLVFWHETFVRTIESVLGGQEPPLPKGTFAELNARAVRENAGVPIARPILRFHAAQSRLEELAAHEAAHALAIPVKAGSKPRSLSELLIEAEAHIRNHEAKVRRQLQGQPAARRSRRNR